MNMKDAGHLFRMASLFLLGIVVFLVLRSFLVPKSFGQYGHYRGNALAEVKEHAIKYAGHQTCETCHTDVLEIKEKGKHARVACESCHGPLAKHADDPTGVQPDKLDTKVLCVRCHEASTAKPKKFPQVVSEDHAGGLACNECHKPHSPVIETEASAAGGKKK